MKYIGIRGHRGAGKSTVAYLLGNTIQYLLDHGDEHPIEQFTREFEAWCKDFREDETCISRMDLDRVIIEGFGDTPRMLLSMLTGIPYSDMWNDDKKDHLVINLKNFETIEVDNISSFPEKLWEAREYFITTTASTDPEVLKDDVYMTLRELILYFGIYVMQNAFGLNVWIKSLVANSAFFTGLFPDDKNGYKIFQDIKARSEISYIKDKGGVIIKVSRPGHKKTGGMDLLKGDSRFDYEVNISGELEGLRDQILTIAKSIIHEKA